MSLLTRRHVVLVAAACIAAAAFAFAGVIAGRTLVPADSQTFSPVSSATGLAATPAAIRRVAGVPVSFPHSTDGAMDAAIAFVEIEEGSLVLRPEAYRAAWQEMSTPGYWAATGRAAAERVLDAHAAAIADAAAGRPAYVHTWPLTAATIRADTDRVVVRVWALSIVHVGSSTNGVFSAGTVEVAWSDGRWQLDGGNSDLALGNGSTGAFVLSSGPGLPTFLATGGEQP